MQSLAPSPQTYNFVAGRRWCWSSLGGRESSSMKTKTSKIFATGRTAKNSHWQESVFCASQHTMTWWMAWHYIFFSSSHSSIKCCANERSDQRQNWHVSVVVTFWSPTFYIHRRVQYSGYRDIRRDYMRIYEKATFWRIEYDASGDAWQFGLIGRSHCSRAIWW